MMPSAISCSPPRNSTSGDERREAANGIPEEQRLDDEIATVGERHERGRKADVARDLERHDRERCDAFEREIPQPPVVPLGLARVAAVAVVLDLATREPDPREQALHEAAALGKAANRRRPRAARGAGSRRRFPECRSCRCARSRGRTRARVAFLSQLSCAAAAAPHQHDVVALLPGADHLAGSARGDPAGPRR